MDFNEIYNTYWQKIFRLCMGYVNDEQWAKDICQDTFIKVWEQLPNFRNEASVSTWIFRIASNNCLGQIARDKRIPKGDFPSDVADTIHHNNDKELEYLYKCIAELNEIDRIIISLELEDVKQAQIAGIVGISEANVRVRIHRIKEKLKQNSKTMSNNIELKALWMRGAGVMPESKEISEMAHAYKRKHLLKIIVSNVLLIATSIFIAYIISEYHPHMLTTKLGALLVILAMAVYLPVYNLMIPLLWKIKQDSDNSEYIQNFAKLKARQKFMNTTMLNIYYALLSTGILMYMIEPSIDMNLLQKILAYGLTASWIIFSWFYFRARSIRKQEKETNDLIERFENLSRQLKEQSF